MSNKKRNIAHALFIFENEMGHRANFEDEKDVATINILALGIDYALSGNLLTPADFDSLNDTIWNATDKTYDNATLYKIWLLVPNNIKQSAIHWGMDDTPTRDEIYLWAKNHLTIFDQFTPQVEEL